MMKKKYILLLPFLLSLTVILACTKSKNKDVSSLPENPTINIAHLTADWYPQDPIQLNKNIDLYLAQSEKKFSVVADNTQIKALIVPHAGYYYSGLCAACAYKTLLEPNSTKNKIFSRVIILCPSHRTFLNNIALPDYDTYQTCLGDVRVDAKAINELSKAGSIFRVNCEAHKFEHAIEIQLPFLQKTVADFEIVPLIVGDLTANSFYDAVNQLKKIVDDKTLIIVSSDFTHYGQNYTYAPFSKMIFNQIRYLDSLAIQSITSFSGYDFEKMLKDTGATICGRIAINLLLGVIQSGVYQKLNAKLACYYNSAQLTKAMRNNSINFEQLLKPVKDEDCKNSVSYASIIFTTQAIETLTPSQRLTTFDKKSLLQLARLSIENYFKPNDSKLPIHLLYPVITTPLQQRVGAFVTLNTKDGTKNGSLRGCIGQILTSNPLYQTISEMAISAAFNDNRFPPLQEYELANIKIDITILSTPQKISSYKDIKIGLDGVILKKLGTGGKVIASALFLPQVPVNFGWDLVTTLEHLSQKAGIGCDEWKSDCEFEVFQGFEIDEE